MGLRVFGNRALGEDSGPGLGLFEYSSLARRPRQTRNGASDGLGNERGEGLEGAGSPPVRRKVIPASRLNFTESPCNAMEMHGP